MPDSSCHPPYGKMRWYTIVRTGSIQYPAQPACMQVLVWVTATLPDIHAAKNVIYWGWGNPPYSLMMTASPLWYRSNRDKAGCKPVSSAVLMSSSGFSPMTGRFHNRCHFGNGTTVLSPSFPPDNCITTRILVSRIGKDMGATGTQEPRN